MSSNLKQRAEDMLYDFIVECQAEGLVESQCTIGELNEFITFWVNAHFHEDAEE